VVVGGTVVVVGGDVVVVGGTVVVVGGDVVEVGGAVVDGGSVIGVGGLVDGGVADGRGDELRSEPLSREVVVIGAAVGSVVRVGVGTVEFGVGVVVGSAATVVEMASVSQRGLLSVVGGSVRSVNTPNTSVRIAMPTPKRRNSVITAAPSSLARGAVRLSAPHALRRRALDARDRAVGRNRDAAARLIRHGANNGRHATSDSRSALGA